ncbi:MAG: AraC family transcriptional regulator [Pseudomonadota bacterium]|nr:AraC family transcriptional regulator [Pseudomonadota bacterium]
MSRQSLTDRTLRYHARLRAGETALPGLSVFRRDETSELDSFIYEPVLCLILQGAKTTTSGTASVEVGPGDALVVSHDLPVVSRITQASADQPYVALVVTLDLAIVRGLYEQVADEHSPPAAEAALTGGPADAALIAALDRYIALADDPLDARVLGPAILREIHYRLLLSAQGAMLRNLLVADSHASRIARAIQTVRTSYEETLSVPDLARTAGMSASSFHQHFKSVTGTSPLRYQKDLRLIQARRLIVESGRSVSQAAFAVGYESPTQFSRDYSRMFGHPPSRETLGAPVSLSG